MSEEIKGIIRYIITYYRILVIVIDIIVFAIVTILMIHTMISLIDNIRALYSFNNEISPAITVSNMFLLIVYAEILRSIVVARRRPEMYLIGITEAGFVILVKEVIVSTVEGVSHEVLIPAGSTLILAIVLLILYRYILPHKRAEKSK
ncbi:MAG: hypothetical protein DRO40_08770 [Thermoprotei archaeon]|nr:MAG: hypothetical protein DRO40_08770 [Thermoprotei archaeon]